MLFLPRQFKRRHHSFKSQEGMVIVIALFMMALVASLAYVMMARLERDTYRTRLLVRHAQAMHYAQGLEAWGIDQLNQNWIRRKTQKLIDQLPLAFPANHVDGFEISGTLYDMQARFNINTVADKSGQEGFMRLIKTVYPKLADKEAHSLIEAMVDWVKPGAKRREFNAHYLKMSPPYTAPLHPFISVSELLLVKGMTPAIYQALMPFLTALPNKAPINLQTAPAEVLMTLSPNLDKATAQAFIRLRKDKPVLTPDMFNQLELMRNHQIEAGQNITVSSYFLLETRVSVEKQRIVLYTLLERTASELHSTIKILWQSRGVW